MSETAINPALQFIQIIQTAGVSDFAPAQIINGFRAVGTAIDSYSQAVPNDTSLADLCRVIGGLPARGRVATEAQEEILGLLAARSQEVDRAVRFAAKIDSVGQASIAGTAAVVNLEAPFDLGAEWRWIPPGEFLMGSRDNDPYARSDEKPLRTVMTGGFYIQDHPVTNAEFRAFLEAVGRRDTRRFPKKFAGDDQPTVIVTQREAVEYSRWLGEEKSARMGITVIGRLPTEVEWEKAAKGPSGDEFIKPATPEQAHFNAEATRAVNHPAAINAANGYGLKDMIGNVREWTSSPWRVGSFFFVVRGASWDDEYRDNLRAAYRHCYYPTVRGNFGFRPVLSP